MNANTAAKRLLIPLFGLLALAAPALAQAGDGGGYLGVMLQDITPAMAKALQLEEASGVLVSDVVDDGPAEKAGLLDGDVIVSFGGKDVSEDTPLTKLVQSAAPGDKVDVVVIRDGKRKTVPVEIGERKEVFAWTSAAPKGEDMEVLMKKLHDGQREITIMMQDDEDRGWLGVHIDDLGEQLGQYFEVEDGKGVLVTEVVADSPAAKAGLKAGDVITKVGDEAVAGTGELHEALAETEAGDEVKIGYLRKGKNKTADVTLGEAPESAEAPMPHMSFHGKDGEYRITAPSMMMRHMAPMGDHDVHVMRAPGKHVEIIREMELEDQELDQLRGELDQLRKELQELRSELKK